MSAAGHMLALLAGIDVNHRVKDGRKVERVEKSDSFRSRPPNRRPPSLLPKVLKALPPFGHFALIVSGKSFHLFPVGLDRFAALRALVLSR